MSNSSQSEKNQTPKATHNMNGSGKNRSDQNRKNQKSNDVQFYPEEKTAIEGTSKYSSAVIFRDYELKAMELQRADHRHTQYVGAVIHQLENATQAKFREKHVDLVREAIHNVKDKLDELELYINSETTRVENEIGDAPEHDIKTYSNVKKYKDVPLQTVSAYKWVDLLEKADALIVVYDKGLWSSRCNIDPIERGDLVNKLVKMFNVFPSFVSNQNKEVEKKAKMIDEQNATNSNQAH